MTQTRSDAELSQGAKAVANGFAAQNAVKEVLMASRYTRLTIRPATLSNLLVSRTGLFQETGCFLPQCSVPLRAVYHAGRERSMCVDFAVYNPARETVLLSIKSQQSDGTADEKLEYEIQQLIATELPAALLVLGPMKGRDGETGWRSHVLQEIWERSRHFGSSRLYLFREFDRLIRWIRDGLPVAGRSVTASDIFSRYCDHEP